MSEPTTGKMRPKTAALMLQLAIDENDEAAVRIACQHDPWQFVDIEVTDYSLKVWPINMVIKNLKRAISDRNGSLDRVRKESAQCLTAMVQMGYYPKLEALQKLCAQDKFVFIRVLREVAKTGNQAYANIFHRVAEGDGSSDYDPPPHETVKLFLSMKRDPNEVDQDGNTFLHSMWKSVNTMSLNSLKVFHYTGARLAWQNTKILLDAGAAPWFENHLGQSVIGIIRSAAQRGMVIPPEGEVMLAEAEARWLDVSSEKAPAHKRPGGRL